VTERAGSNLLESNASVRSERANSETMEAPREPEQPVRVQPEFSREFDDWPTSHRVALDQYADAGPRSARQSFARHGCNGRGQDRVAAHYLLPFVAASQVQTGADT